MKRLNWDLGAMVLDVRIGSCKKFFFFHKRQQTSPQNSIIMAVDSSIHIRSPSVVITNMFVFDKIRCPRWMRTRTYVRLEDLQEMFCWTWFIWSAVTAVRQNRKRTFRYEFEITDALITSLCWITVPSNPTPNRQKPQDKCGLRADVSRQSNTLTCVAVGLWQ